MEDCEPAVILEAIRTLISQKNTFGFEQFVDVHSFEQLTEKLGRIALSGFDTDMSPR